MSLRRYVLVRTAWQVGVLFVFVSLAYVVAWVVPSKPLGHDPGYGGFLGELARGSLGQSASLQPGTVGPSVGSVVWDASRVTLSFLLVAGVFAVSLGTLFAFVGVRAPRWRPVVRAVGIVFVSLLPIWTGLYLAFYLGADWHVIRVGGYCPLRATPSYDCHGLRSWLASLVLPGLALGIYFAAIYGRWLAAAFRHGTTEYRREVDDGHDAAETRRAIPRRYGLRFAKLLSRDFAFAIGFGAFVETVFSLPGLGNTVVSAAFGNAPLMAGALVAASVLTAGLSFLVDVASAAIELRCRRF
jgi:ABC-type dipeptide/oligopeptide/nickel transport system permease component